MMQRALAEIAGGVNGPAGKSGRTMPRPRVYCEAWPNPRISSPPWVAELVHIAGGQPVLPAGEKVSDEQVATAAPDVIVLAWAATGGKSEPRRALENPAWRQVPAVRHGHVFVIRDELLNTPAPVLVQGARQLRRAIRAGYTPALVRRKTVVAAVIEREGRILICQRRSGDELGLKWEFPGGKLEPGETPECGLARELREELGVGAKIGAEIYRRHFWYASSAGGRDVDLLFFSATIGEQRVENLAFEQVVWAERGSLRQYDFLPADRELVERLATGAE